MITPADFQSLQFITDAHRLAFAMNFPMGMEPTPACCGTVAEHLPWGRMADALFTRYGWGQYLQQRELALMLYIRPGFISQPLFLQHIAAAFATLYPTERRVRK